MWGVVFRVLSWVSLGYLFNDVASTTGQITGISADPQIVDSEVQLGGVSGGLSDTTKQFISMFFKIILVLSTIYGGVTIWKQWKK